MPLSDTDKTKLETIRTNYVDQLVLISANPKPTYSVNGQSVSWEGYQRFLQSQILALDDMLLADQAPFEEVSQGFT